MSGDGGRQTRARMLRRAQSLPEGLLWKALRSRQVQGIKFRRQHPIGHLTVDFCCIELNLVIEVDSKYHAGRGEDDRRRDAYLRQHGWRVLRVQARQVLRDLPSVVETIKAVAAAPEHPLTRPFGPPSPPAGGEVL